MLFALPAETAIAFQVGIAYNYFHCHWCGKAEKQLKEENNFLSSLCCENIFDRL